MLKIEFVEDAYQYALKVEDKLKRKSQVNSKGNEKLDNSAQAKSSAAKDEQKPMRKRKGQEEVNIKVNFINELKRDTYLLNVLRGIVVEELLW